MSYIKTLLSRYPSPFLKPSLNPNDFLKFHPFLKSCSNFFSTQIPNSVSYPKIPQKSSHKNKNKRPLDIVFKEALGLCEKEQTLGSLIGENDENGDLKKKLWELEMEISQLKAASASSSSSSSSSTSEEEKVKTLEELERRVKGKDEGVSEPNPKTLAALFGSEGKEEGGSSVGVGKEVVFKEISQDMQLFLRLLYDKGYFQNVNFLPGNKFDMTCFYEEYAREYVKFAIERFGQDNKEIAKWVSGTDAKSVALFGCPTVEKKNVLAAKALRYFFKAQEEIVCSKCILKESCKYASRTMVKGDNTTLRLDSLLRLLRAYSMEEVSPQLKLSDELKACVSRLILEVINLSKSPDDAASGDGGELASGQ